MKRGQLFLSLARATRSLIPLSTPSESSRHGGLQREMQTSGGEHRKAITKASDGASCSLFDAASVQCPAPSLSPLIRRNPSSTVVLLCVTVRFDPPAQRGQHFITFFQTMAPLQPENSSLHARSAPALLAFIISPASQVLPFAWTPEGGQLHDAASSWRWTRYLVLQGNSCSSSD